jgi:hypothetical protein
VLGTAVINNNNWLDDLRRDWDPIKVFYLVVQATEEERWEELLNRWEDGPSPTSTTSIFLHEQRQQAKNGGKKSLPTVICFHTDNQASPCNFCKCSCPRIHHNGAAVCYAGRFDCLCKFCNAGGTSNGAA